MMTKRNVLVTLGLVMLIALGLAIGHQSDWGKPPTVDALNKELTYCDWVGYEVHPVMAAFEKEFAVKIRYSGMGAQEAFLEAIHSKKCDVLSIGNEYIQALATQGLITDIDYRQVPNFKNIAANFRDPSYDPENRHSVPFRWGTTGLLVRTDQITVPVTRWSDLGVLGQTALWDMPRDTLEVALKAIGYSINSESPAELEEALQFLLKRKSKLIFWPADQATIAPPLIEGKATIAFGWSFDALDAHNANPNIHYILPEEGTILWGESLVIAASSPRKKIAEEFINFILRPDMSAQFSNVLHFATANEAARPFIDADLLNNPIVFPPNQALKNAEITLQLSPAGEKLRTDIWARFLATGR